MTGPRVPALGGRGLSVGRLDAGASRRAPASKIGQGSDEGTGPIFIDRFIPMRVAYLANYGRVPSTLDRDADRGPTPRGVEESVKVLDEGARRYRASKAASAR